MADTIRETLDALTTPIARCRRDGCSILVNSAWSERIGAEGISVLDVVDPADVRQIERLLGAEPGEQRAATARWRGEEAAGLVRARGVSEDVVVLELSVPVEADSVVDPRLDALARLAGGMANDFANVLSIVLNYAEFGLQTATDPRTRHYLEAIRSGADRAVHLTDELLVFARGGGDEAPDPLDVGAMVEERRDLLARALGPKVRLEIDRIPGAPPVRLARGSLDQVLTNLCTNAREAMPAGGRLCIEVGPTALTPVSAVEAGLAAGAYTRIAVIDDGVGMAPEVRARALDPFFSTKGDHRRGLGLSVVYGIVRSAGGAVRVRSEPGAGTTVELLLPAPRVAADRLPGRIPAQGRGETVLVVDDVEEMRSIAVHILLENGYDAIEASSGEEALALFEATDEPCDLLLTDIVMPRMNGAQLAERVRTLRPGARVLFMSGYGTPALLAVPSVMNVPLLDKPFQAEQLLEAVRRALDV